MNNNIILNTDSYKISHFLQYPEDTTHISSYIEARGGVYRSLFFGLQAFIKQYLIKPINWVDVEEASEILPAHGLPFNKEDWKRIILKHQGRLPIRIDALPEGTVARTGVPLVQVHNTDPEFPWLTSYLETALLRAVWYPTSVATTSFEIRQLINQFYKETATTGAEGSIDFKLHDFGARGATSEESAAIGGLAHLVSFKGTDTLSAILLGRNAYKEPMAGFSIPAAEHSTITAWGKDKESEAFKNMVNQFSSETSIYAVVSDSYDIHNAVDKLWGQDLKELVKEKKGQLVVRPDSGDPEEMVIFCLESLAKNFGFYTNSKGYKTLDNSVRVIQGDGVNPESIKAILQRMKRDRWSAENVAFGMGGALLQKVDRDTQKFAMKANAIKVGESDWNDVYKDPVTDKVKKSKRGRQAVVDRGGFLTSIREDELNGEKNFLRPVYEGGKILEEESLETIRKRAKSYWDR